MYKPGQSLTQQLDDIQIRISELDSQFTHLSKRLERVKTALIAVCEQLDELHLNEDV